MVRFAGYMGDLQFVLYGVVPARRFLLETMYGVLVLRNGVPVAYGAVTALFNSSMSSAQP